MNPKRVARRWRQAGWRVPGKHPQRGRRWLAAGSLVRRRAERPSHSPQLSLFPEEPLAVRGRARLRGKPAAATGKLDAPRDATTLDRLHAAMLLQASGRTEALRALLRTEQERGPDLLRLANALSALYPRSSEEKRLLDAMLLTAPR